MLRRKGFTLVELLVVVLILGALAAIAVPRIMGGAESAKIGACETNVDLINNQIELFYSETGDWPAALSDVVGTADDPTDYFPDGPPVCPVDGTAYALRTTIGLPAMGINDHLPRPECEA